MSKGSDMQAAWCARNASPNLAHPNAVAMANDDASFTSLDSWQHIAVPVRQHPVNCLLQ